MILINIVLLILCGFAVERITEILVNGDIFFSLRNFLVRKSKFFGSLITCGYCTSVWISGLVVWATPSIFNCPYFKSCDIIADILIKIFILHGFAVVIHGIVHKPVKYDESGEADMPKNDVGIRAVTEQEAKNLMAEMIKGNLGESLKDGFHMIKNMYVCYNKFMENIHNSEFGKNKPIIYVNPDQIHTWLDQLINDQLHAKRDGMKIIWDLTDGSKLTYDYFKGEWSK